MYEVVWSQLQVVTDTDTEYEWTKEICQLEPPDTTCKISYLEV